MKQLEIHFLDNKINCNHYQANLEENEITIFISNENIDSDLIRDFNLYWFKGIDKEGKQYFFKAHSLLKPDLNYPYDMFNYSLEYIISLDKFQKIYNNLEDLLNDIKGIILKDEIVSLFYSYKMDVRFKDEKLIISEPKTPQDFYEFDLRKDQKVLCFFYPLNSYKDLSRTKINLKPETVLQFRLSNELEFNDLILIRSFLTIFFQIICGQSNVHIDKLILKNENDQSIGKIKFYPFKKNKIHQCFKYEHLKNCLNQIFKRITNKGIFLVQLPFNTDPKSDNFFRDILIYSSALEWLFSNLNCELIKGKSHSKSQKAKQEIEEILMNVSDSNKYFRNQRTKVINDMNNPTLELKIKSLFSKYESFIFILKSYLFDLNFDINRTNINIPNDISFDDIIERFIELRNKIAHGDLDIILDYQDGLLLTLFQFASYGLIFKLFNIDDFIIWESIKQIYILKNLKDNDWESEE